MTPVSDLPGEDRRHRAAIRTALDIPGPPLGSELEPAVEPVAIASSAVTCGPGRV